MSSLNLSVNRDWVYLKKTIKKTCPSWLTLHSKSKWYTLTVRQVFCMSTNFRMSIEDPRAYVLNASQPQSFDISLHKTGCNCPPHRERHCLLTHRSLMPKSLGQNVQNGPMSLAVWRRSASDRPTCCDWCRPPCWRAGIFESRRAMSLNGTKLAFWCQGSCLVLTRIRTRICRFVADHSLH